MPTPNATQALRSKGWRPQPDGSWSPPAKKAKAITEPTARPVSLVESMFTDFGLPAPVSEYAFHPSRKWRFDYAWPACLVALEVEGGVFTRGAHGSVSGILRDMEKYNAAACAGWVVLRVLPGDLLKSETVRLVSEAIGAVKMRQTLATIG